MLHSCIVLPPVGHSSNHEYHCCQLTGQSSGVSNFYRTFTIFMWLSLVQFSGYIFYFPVVQQSNLGLGWLIIEVSRAHIDTHTHPVWLLWRSDRLVTYTTRDTHNRRISMASNGFELAIPAIKRLQTDVLESKATGRGLLLYTSAQHFAQRGTARHNVYRKHASWQPFWSCQQRNI